MKMRAETLRADALAFEQLFDLRFTNSYLNQRSLVSDMNDVVLVVTGKRGVSRAELEVRLINKHKAILESNYNDNDVGKEGRFTARVILSGAIDLLSELA